MNTIEQSNKLITAHISNIERQMRELKKENTLSLKKQKLRSFKIELESLQSELNMFELELCNANEKQREMYFVNFNNYESQANGFEKEAKQVEDEMANRPDREELQLIDQGTVTRNQPQDIQQMDRNQLEVHVNDKQKEAMDDLDQMMIDLSKGKNIMNEINIEIQIQKEKLSKATEDIDATYSITKRTKKLLTYFKRQIMKDKIIWVFLVLVIIAIIVIIILKAVGFKSDSFNSNTVPNSNATTTSTTGTTKARLL